MSVPKYKRKTSEFEVFNNGYKMRRAITDLVSRKFGNKPLPVPDGGDYQVERRNEFIKKFIDDETTYIINLLRDINCNLHTANAIYPTNIRELEERRIYQDLAIAGCFNIYQELQYVIETVDVDVNKLLLYDEIIQKQITLIKSWRKSDNRYKKTLGLNP